MTYTKAPGSATVAAIWDIGVAPGTCSMTTTDRGAALSVPRQSRIATLDKLSSERSLRPSPKRDLEGEDLEGGDLELRQDDGSLNHS
jgi:hypothetical protein